MALERSMVLQRHGIQVTVVKLGGDGQRRMRVSGTSVIFDSLYIISRGNYDSYVELNSFLIVALGRLG